MDKNFLIENVKNNFNKAKELDISNAQAFAVNVRSALEFSVKLFWLVKYDTINKEDFSLLEAIKDTKFSSCFERHTITYMHLIRQDCNDVIHGEISLSNEMANELIINLSKCVKDIERALNLSILNALTPKNPEVKKPTEEIKPEVKVQTEGGFTLEEDKFCCRVFLKNYVINKADISVSGVVLEIQKAYPKMLYSAIRTKLQTLAGVCSFLNIENSFNCGQLPNYTKQSLTAMKDVLKELKI